MKTIDTKSLLLGVFATIAILSLTGSRMSETDDKITFASSPAAVGIYNKSTRMLYFYKGTMGGMGIQETPSNVYEVTNGGALLVKRN